MMAQEDSGERGAAQGEVRQSVEVLGNDCDCADLDVCASVSACETGINVRIASLMHTVSLIAQRPACSAMARWWECTRETRHTQLQM